MNGQAEFIFSVGPVMVYELKPGFVMGMFQSQKFYWKYHDKASIYGPFSSLQECTMHFDAHAIASGRASVEPIKNNVIVVDFKNKKRVR